MALNRRDFVTKLLSVPVGVALSGTVVSQQSVKSDALRFSQVPTERERERELLSQWLASKVDEAAFNMMTGEKYV